MKAIYKISIKVITGIICLAIIAMVFGFLPAIEESENDINNVFSLAKPAFAQTSAGSFLQEEAGIAAYVNTGTTLDPARAKSIFKTVEVETSEYIIGSVSVQPDDRDFTGSYTHDVHAFVHKDGWIVSYYLRSEPVSKMIGHKYHASGTLNTNYLAEGLTRIGSTLGMAITSSKYYHFQYPGANRITKIVGSNYKVKIPTDFQVFETSFAGYNTVDVDGKKIWNTTNKGSYGIIGLDKLNPGTLHNIERAPSTAVIILYLEP